MQDIKVARTFKTDFEESTETSRKDIVSKLLRRIYLKMPRTFLNFDKALEMSDSDSEMPYSRSPSPSSGTDDVTPDTSGTCETGNLGRELSKAESISTSYNDFAAVSSSSNSAFQRIHRTQTTPDNNQSNVNSASDSSMSSWIPISPPNGSDSRGRFYSRKLHYPAQVGENFPDHLSTSYFSPCSSASVDPVSSTSSGYISPHELDNDPSVFLHSDSRIPFANYFNNLVKLLHCAAAKGQLGKSRNLSTTEKNVFNFYWDTNSRDTESSCTMDESLNEMNSSQKKMDSSCSRNSDRSESDDERSATTSPPSINSDVNRMATAEGSPILSGHFVHSPPFLKTSPNLGQSFLPPFPQFASSPAGPHPSYPASGPYPLLRHSPYVPMSGFRFQHPEAAKSLPVKKYKCDVCGKAFSRSNTLVTHKRIHTGAKPFKCEICGRAFRQPGNLTRHRLTHTSVKPYVCPTCNKAFNRASNLNTHMRTHANYRPFTCTWCGKGFNQKVDLKIHSYTHTGKKSLGYRR